MNLWIEFVKHYAHANDLSYLEALEQAEKYRNDCYKKGGSLKSSYVAKLIATGKVDYNKVKNKPSQYIISRQRQAENKPINVVDLLRINTSNVNKDAIVYAIEVSLAEERNQKLANLKKKKINELHDVIKNYKINKDLINLHYRNHLQDRLENLQEGYTNMYNYINDKQKRSYINKINRIVTHMENVGLEY